MMGTNSYRFLVIIFLPLLLLSGNTTTLREVILNSTLIRGHLALPGQLVVFTCVTRNSTILEWQSNEHIGTDGDNIQIYSVGSRDNVTSVTIPTTYATRDSVTVENGLTVIESRLYITTSEQFPTSSITCRINGQGPIKTISFNTTARALQEIILSSTLIHGHLALPGQRVVFMCVVRNSTILEWQSNEHIGTDGDDIQIYSVGSRDNVTSVTIPTTYAIRESVTVENGITVIESQLYITASDRFTISSVTCGINSLGPRQTISFNTTARALQGVRLNSTLIRGNLAYSQQRVVFTCVTRNSTILEWQSNEHIGTEGDNIQIYSVGSRDNVTSVTIPTTYATRDSVTVENGITEIVSQLFITASDRFPTSSVTCGINSLGPRQTISFNITDENPPAPKFNSTLQGGVSACPGDRHLFKCIASYSHNIEWTSDEYIGGRMEITSSSPIGTPLRISGNTDTYAMLESVELVNGGLQLTSLLNIVISSSLREQNHTINCLNIDLGTQQSITFRMAENCEIEVTVTSNEVEVENNQDGDTSAVAAIVTGSIFSIIFIIVMIGIIILAIMCIRNRDGFKITPFKKPQAMTEASQVEGGVREQSQEQTKAEINKEMEKSSPEAPVQNSEPVSLSSVNTSATAAELSQGGLTDSDTVGEDAESRSPCHEHGTHSSVVHTGLGRLNSTEAEA